MLVASAGVSQAPTGPAFSLLLLAHVLTTVIGFGSVGLTGFEALRVRRCNTLTVASSLERFFTPGFNFVGRTLYGVPVFGAALVLASHRFFSFRSAFVQVGLGLWIVAIFVAEMAVWPAEHEIQQLLSAGWETIDRASLRAASSKVLIGSASVLAIFVVACVFMFGQPK